MADVEAKALHAKTELTVSDALDEIRMRNERIDRVMLPQLSSSAVEQDALRRRAKDQAAQRQEDLEYEEAARRAFSRENHVGEHIVRTVSDEDNVAGDSTGTTPMPSLFQRSTKKKDYSAALGIKRKEK